MFSGISRALSTNAAFWSKRVSVCRYSTKPSYSARASWASSGWFLGGTVLGASAYTLGRGEVSSYQKSVNSTIPLGDLESPKYATDKELESAVKEIREIFLRNSAAGADQEFLINNSKEQIEAQSDTYFNSHHASPDQRPKYVVRPRSTQEVSEVLKVCHKYKVPVVPTGGKSSLEGHFISTRSGITLDITSMDKVIELNKEDLDIKVQAGLGWEKLADILDGHNLLFSSDPGPGATISGICANNASGPKASRYGETYKNVLSLTVVLADGTIVKTKQRARKSSAGYNLNSLFIGSEGTLGIITEATLKLYVKPAFSNVIVVPFKTLHGATDAVTSILLKGTQLDAVELLDDKMMAVINKSGETSRKWHENPTLFIKLGGSNSKVVEEISQDIKNIAKNHGSIDFRYATDEDEKTELWSARKVALWSTINQGKTVNKNMQLWTTDAAVPFSKLTDFLIETQEDIHKHGLESTLVAHIGDGNSHSFILYLPEQRETAEKVVARMVRRAIKYEGTCTGEHGIGYGKRKYLLEEVGEVTVDLMRNIKLAMDPLRILNPDKIFKVDPNDLAHS